MITRRHFLAGLPALSLPLPGGGIARAQRALSASDVISQADGLTQLRSLVVRRSDTELIARRFRGPGLDTPANIKSVSKTLVALLTGIAIERGHLSGPDAPVLPLLGRPTANNARDALTVDHLLSMRTGLQSTSGPRYGAWVESNNWVRFALNSDLVDRPGGRFIYSTGGWHVLGAVLAEATGRSLLSLSREWLGDPLGIDIPAWERDPQGYYLGGNQMAMSPRDLARLGQMILQGGSWEGRRIVPEDWLRTSWEPRGRSPWSGDSYGYGWFLTQLGGEAVAYGRGYGGQVLAVVPARDLTIAITSDPGQPARTAGHFGDLAALMADIVRLA